VGVINISKITLYKFRSLANQVDFDRAKAIMETGHFWCSKFSELNDPMEGVFFMIASNIESAREKIDDIYSEKNRYKICSFSGAGAFRNPAMWGYYANGFRGMAIEIEVDEKEVEKINLANDIVSIENSIASDYDVKKILTTKLACWKHEDEHRFLRKSESNYHKIGKINTVYFGSPYKDTINHQTIYSASHILSNYNDLKNELKNVANGITCYSVKVDGDKVVKVT
jgi:hypothetical protein